jgi:putative selenium metabolism hydrolase
MEKRKMKPNKEMDQKGLIDFALAMVRTPSVSGQEGEVAKVIAQEMKKLSFDEVIVDEKNSVLGRIRGTGRGKSLMLNGHIDHADVGTMSDPYKAVVLDGRPSGYAGDVICGRGTTDMKGPMASMIYGAGMVKKKGIPLKGDIWVIANSLEEPARGEGILHILNNRGIRTDMAICGEPSDMEIKIGQTGRMDFKIIAKGLSSHASYPEKGKNAIYEMNKFLQKFLETYQTPNDKLFGKLPVAVIGISSSPPPVTPIVPDKCEIFLTRRFLHIENRQAVQKGIEVIFDDIKRCDVTFEAAAEYLGELPPFYIDPSEKIVTLLQKSFSNVMEKPAPMGVWRFGTEAGYLMQHGIPCVGFGPGIPDVAHTPREYIPVDQLVNSARIYSELIRVLNEDEA